MDILFIHADYVKYKVGEKGPAAEKIDKAKEAESMEEPLIAFVSVEETDEKSGDADGTAERAFEEIEDVSSKIKVDRVALFPFAHLSDNLAAPDFALSVIKKLESKLQKSGFDSFRAPFGWYKKFEFRSKGHPLSVLSRSISP